MRKDLNISINKLLDICNICRFSLYLWLHLYKKDNLCFSHNKKYLRITKYNSKISSIIEKYICDYTIKSNYFKYKNLRRNIKRKFYVSISKSHIYHILKKNNITNKKCNNNYYPYDKIKFNKEKELLKKQLPFDQKDNTIAIDETSVKTIKTNKRAWNYKGKRVIKKANKNNFINKSMLMAISNKGVIDQIIKKGSINGEVFNDFMNKIATNNPNKLFLMDNARIHHYKKFKTEFKEKYPNASIIYNVPYSPQFNPIELIFNMLKQKIKNNIQEDKLEENVLNCIKKIPKKNFKNAYDKSFNNLHN